MAKKSTIVPNAVRRTLQAAVSGAERLNPEWSAAIATRLWFRVGRPPGRAVRNRPEVPPGTPFSITVRRTTVRGRRWGDPSAPVAYLLHGWGGWWQQLGAFVPLLLAHGYQIVTFDAPAHGDSGAGEFGRRASSLPEMAVAYEAMVDRFGTPAVTVAHSMGCLAVIWAQRSRALIPERQILVAPAASTQGMLEIFTRTIGLGPASLEPFKRRFHTRIGRPLGDFDLLPLIVAEGAAGRLPPALIVHDTGDRMTSPRESEEVAANWPGSRLLLTEGQGHYRVLRAPETIAAADEFLTFSSTVVVNRLGVHPDG